ncbi:hypothetical protein KIN20_016476 [Parelaphostrongylus tenuis]|uniref:DNA replication factor Dna2 N-terminal domain-containing protein n=1 Tax=Parelaphostrongylus tenuis TaxID=148309 RepID=A0AAD5QPT7_PARTN|nr:hypothetical protein KIN20_016476 [Parelaphostrongylus tenuis]
MIFGRFTLFRSQISYGDWLRTHWQRSLRDDIANELVALDITPTLFETELEPYAKVIVDWIQTHIPGGESYHPLSASTHLSRVHDIEETIWSPQLGMKGKIDVTMEVRILVNRLL